MRRPDLWPRGVRRLLRLRFGVRGLAREIDEEIRFHIACRIRDLVAGGRSPEHAREIAEREFGDVGESRRELLEVDRRRADRERRAELLDSIGQDVRYAARGMRRRPGFAVVTILTLALGIAANATMFGVVDQLLLRPPPGIADPGGVHRIYFKVRSRSKLFTSAVNSYPMFMALRRDAPKLGELATFYTQSFSMGRGPDARSVHVQLVSGNYFRLLGVRLDAGRAFAPGEDQPPRGAAVAVVSAGLASREFGDATAALGRRLLLDGTVFTVIGVAPSGFTGVDRESIDMWVPISALAADVMPANWYVNEGSYWVQAVARPSAGVDLALATSQATAAVRSNVRKLPDKAWRDTTGTVVLGPLVGTRTPDGFSPEAKVSLWLIGVSVIVLLVACANVANLLIARMLERRREVAVRLALGVSRGRLARQLLTETALLAAASATAALIVSRWAGQFVERSLLPGIVWSDSVVDTRVLAFTLAAAVLCIGLAGLAPVMQGIATPVVDGLKSASRQIAGGHERLRRALLAMQAGLSVVLLVGAGLFVHSLRQVTTRDVGIDLDRVVLVSMNLEHLGFGRPQVEDVYRRALERVRALPGVASASIARVTVPGRSASGIAFKVSGYAKRLDIPGGGPYYDVVNDDFFTTLGARIVAGRGFTNEEQRTPGRVMLINRMLADAYWLGKNPIAQCVKLGSDSTCTQIVGVVQNIMLFSLVNDDRAMVYLPPTHVGFGNEPPGGLLVRSAGDPSTLIPLLRNEVQGLEANMPYVSILSYASIVAPQLRPWRLGATMFTLFGAIALLIAAIGLYSVIAYWVSQRTHEIGVRIALGAQAPDVVRLVAWQAARSIGLGLVVGTAIALVGSRWVSGLLYATSPRDPAIYAMALALVIMSGGLAVLLPARRSASVDPAIALREE
jgi:putative ABC transport system permease protein